MSYYLVHIDPPYWKILEVREDPELLDTFIPEYPSIPEGELDILNEEGISYLEQKYPQKKESEK